MSVQYTQVVDRLKNLKQQYYEALKRKDVEGFLREIAIQQVACEHIQQPPEQPKR